MAKKAESTLKNMLLSLTVIALVAAAVLAALNSVTKDTIEQNEVKKENEAIASVLKHVDENGKVIEEITFDPSKIVKDTVYLCEKNEEGKYTDSEVLNLAYTADGEYAGAAVKVFDPNGFGGFFQMMVGFDSEGNVYGYSILKTNETPGLGAKADQWFQKGNKGDIIGKSPATESDSTMRVKKDKGNVDAITGSTITSRAFLRCINKAYKALPQNEKAQ